MSKSQKHEDLAFQALVKARNHMIKAENSFGDNDLKNIEFAAVKNVRKTIEHTQAMLNELQWTRVRSDK